ncbi:hypothetical protein [Pseudomonas fulva]|uniref:hypothetical protein n=1 Tax=Pseudomonas fulva TaxID=47880 RepID=UPI0012B5A72B|nr:hypothetical protein [Pseudomonas fulva]
MRVLVRSQAPWRAPEDANASSTERRKQHPQEIFSALDAAQNYVVPFAVWAEMASFDQAEDEAFCLGSRHAKVLLGCAAVNVINEAFPALALATAGGIGGERGRMDKGRVIARTRVVLKEGSPREWGMARLSRVYSFAC